MEKEVRIGYMRLIVEGRSVYVKTKRRTNKNTQKKVKKQSRYHIDKKKNKVREKDLDNGVPNTYKTKKIRNKGNQ